MPEGSGKWSGSISFRLVDLLGGLIDASIVSERHRLSLVGCALLLHSGRT